MATEKEAEGHRWLGRVDALHGQKCFAKVHELLVAYLRDHPATAAPPPPPAAAAAAGAASQQHPTPPVASEEVMWRMARSCLDMASELPSESKAARKELLFQGLRCAQLALRLNPSIYEPQTHKWYAVLLSATGEFVSLRQRVENALNIREHALKALSLNPDDATTLHLMGRWCYNVANVGWLERKLATALLGGGGGGGDRKALPTATLEDALQYFLQAEQQEPNNLRNLFWVAEAYAKLAASTPSSNGGANDNRKKGRQEEEDRKEKARQQAVSYYNKVLRSVVQSNNDKAVQREAEVALAKLLPASSSSSARLSSSVFTTTAKSKL